MAFDKTNPADLAALHAEVKTDPVAMGYAAAKISTKHLLDKLNLAENNVVDTPDQYTSAEFDLKLALDVIDPGEITVSSKFSEGHARWLDYLFSAANSSDIQFDEFETKFRALFSGYKPSSNTLDALDAHNKKLSRAEFLFGVGTVISRKDWFALRDYKG